MSTLACLECPNTTVPAAGSTTLDQLAEQIRTWTAEVHKACATALRFALDAGDALIAAKEQVPDGRWAQWLKTNCFLSQRSAQLYMRLARYRADVEHALQEFPGLSLRAAQRLIAEPGASSSETTEATFAMTTATAPVVATEIAAVETESEFVAAETASVRPIPRGLAQFLTRYDPIDLIAAMPASLRDELMGRVVRVGGGGAAELDPRLTQLLREVLEAIAIADRSKTRSVVRHSHEHVARNKLREINHALSRLGRSVCDLEIVFIAKREKKHAA
jgi:hypothetical protein